MNERDLIHAAKVFRANSGANGDKISYADSCKVVLLAAILDQGRTFTQGELELLARVLSGKKSWYRFW